MAEPSASALSPSRARRIAEARETQWQAPSFLKEIFLGNFRLGHPPVSGSAPGNQSSGVL